MAVEVAQNVPTINLNKIHKTLFHYFFQIKVGLSESCDKMHYEAKLCILCIKKRIPQRYKIRFVAESATLLFFFDLLCCLGFLKQILKTL